MGLEVKNPLRAQSKYGLLGSSARTGKFFIGGSQEQKDVLFRWFKFTLKPPYSIVCSKL